MLNIKNARSLSYKLKDAANRPDDFKVLERIPFTIGSQQYPIQLEPSVGDECVIVLLDTETTDLKVSIGCIIELGMVKLAYSPSKKLITSIIDEISMFEDPGTPITEKTTKLTGITDEMVRGRKIDDAQVEEWLNNNPIIIAHNASFDRQFFEKRFPHMSNLRWGCSWREVGWDDLGFEKSGLEALLLKIEYFYDAHRAATDCLAMAWLFHCVPAAFSQLIDSINNNSVLVKAFGSPFEAKDHLKDRGYMWSQESKVWWMEIKESELDDEKQYLDNLYCNGSGKSRYTVNTAETRFKAMS